jgi:hypothetical protein
MRHAHHLGAAGARVLGQDREAVARVQPESGAAGVELGE